MWAGIIQECFIKKVIVKGMLMRFREVLWAPHLPPGGI